LILVDTNIMLRLLEPAHSHCQAAIDAITLLTNQSNESFSTIPHCLHEVYHVLTRVKNGHGKSASEALPELNDLISSFPIHPDSKDFFFTWLALIEKYKVTGRLAYDAKIVAAMIDHEIPTLLSFNDADFLQFNEIAVINPFDVLGRARI
jgi:predicted nucleic acid-binding protein